MRRFAFAVLPVFALALATARAPGQLYEQPLVYGGTLYATQNDTGGGYGQLAQLWDNFQLGSSASIGSVTWYGGYWNGAPGPISQFSLSFWSDIGGLPGVPLATYTIAGNANETWVGPYSYQSYLYSANLSSPFQATAGTQYWLSLVPDIAYPPQWGWAQGTGGDGSAYQYFIYGGPYDFVDGDLAFALYGSEPSEVPEASSMAALVSFMGLGLAGLRRLRKS